MATLRPASEVTNFGWSLTGGANYATILSDQLDGTYCSGPVDSYNLLETLLATGADPGVNTGFSVHARGYYSSNNARLTISVIQGATVIHVSAIALPGSVAEVSANLLEAEAASITDFSDLRIRLEVDGAPIVFGVFGQITDVWLELPNAPANTAIADRCVVQCKHPDPLISAISGVTATSKNVVKADYPVDLADAMGGQVCSWSGLWYPARRIVIVDGLPYGDDNAPKESNPNPGETLP